MGTETAETPLLFMIPDMSIVDEEMERVLILFIMRMMGRELALRPGIHKKPLVRKFGWEGARAGKLMDLARHPELPVLRGLV